LPLSRALHGALALCEQFAQAEMKLVLADIEAAGLKSALD